MSKQQLAAILEMSAQNPIPANATPALMRAWAEDVFSHLPVAENVQIERVNCGPCDGDLILPAGGDASRLIIFYHGGGFFFGSSRTHRVIASNLTRAAGSAVLVPDYRLAPENPAPAAHDDAFAVYQWALKQGYASGKGASHQGTPDDPVVSTELLDLFTLCSLRDGDRKSPTVTPFYADFSGLPPTLVHVGTRERLGDDSVTVVERMKAAGVAAELKIFDGMCHNWQLYAPMLDEGMASIEECGAFIKAHHRP